MTNLRRVIGLIGVTIRGRPLAVDAINHPLLVATCINERADDIPIVAALTKDPIR